MATISGRVAVEETGLGVPNLIVAFSEVTLPGLAEAGEPADPAGAARLPGPGVRLGSVVTGPDGAFAFSHGAALAPVPSDAVPDVPVPQVDSLTGSDGAAVAVAPTPLAAFHKMLSVVVSAPDGAGDAGDARLHVCPLREAGSHEAYAIRIATSTLVAAGVTPPTEPRDPAAALATLEREEEAAVALDAGVRRAAARRVGTSRDERIAYEDGFGGGLLQQLSRVPRTLLHPELLVGPGERVEPKNIAAIESGVRARYSQASGGRLRPRTRFYLDQAQRDRLAEIAGDNGPAVLSAVQVKALLLGTEDGDEPAIPPDLVREEDLLKAFLELSHDEKCGAQALGIATPEQSGQAPGGTADDEAAPFDPQVAVAALLGGLSAPSRPDTERADQASIASALAGFSMRPAPADTPAFFDFHRLEVAFDDVWQEVLDGDVAELGRRVYTRLAELGGNPEHESHAGRPPLAALEAEADVVTRALAPPARALALPRAAGGGISPIFARRVDDDLGDLGDGQNPPSAPPWPPGPIGPTMPDPEQEAYTDQYSTPRDLLARLRAMLTGHHAFTAFGAGPGEHAVNFGIVTTFRQRWEPVTYQAGELIRTIPLAPGETRKYSRKTVINRKRAEKELAKWSQMRRDEQNTTSRAESEIVRKASATTNFSLTTEGTYNIGIAKGDATTKIGRDAAQDASDAKKDFREAVRKAAQEYKQERTLEVSTEDSEEFTATESGEISNPNDELAVTYLFYELQRRYRVDERIHRVRPVVLVAQDMPNPAQITDAWLVAHDWILRRSFLDESFLPALDYLSTKVAGDAEALKHLKKVVEQHQATVESLREDLAELQQQADLRFEEALQAIENRANEIEAEDTDGFFSDFGQALGFGDGQSPDAFRIREEAARKAEERAVDKVKDLIVKLRREVTALDRASERYAEAVAAHRNRQVQIARLRVHVKQNIVHYMQAVWAFESADQRVLRLREMPAPTFLDGQTGTRFRFTGRTGPARFDGVRNGTVLESLAHEVDLEPDLDVVFDRQTLSDIADLHTLLGFHGNYLIFPLTEPNPLTDFMTAPYVDSGWKLVDPDEPAALNRMEFARYVCHLHETLSEEEFTAVKDELEKRYAEMLTSPSRAGEEIIVPTGSLFIEMLPSGHTLLEDFKLAHRAADVRKVHAEVRGAELDNVRYAARIVAGDLADPDIDSLHKVDIQGSAQPLIDVGRG